MADFRWDSAVLHGDLTSDNGTIFQGILKRECSLFRFHATRTKDSLAMLLFLASFTHPFFRLSVRSLASIEEEKTNFCCDGNWFVTFWDGMYRKLYDDLLIPSSFLF